MADSWRGVGWGEIPERDGEIPEQEELYELTS